MLEEVERCDFCFEDTIQAETLKCGHKFCVACIEQLKHKKVCPSCYYRDDCGIITGNQPEGEMDVIINDSENCAGFEDFGRIEITYTFPDGVQNAGHPNRELIYKGIAEKEYLPNNNEGKIILELLRIAFRRKLVFKIERSRTNGYDGVITWNDIHHKTDPKPNMQFGYPDPMYLDRVTDELAAKGVTMEDIPVLSPTKLVEQDDKPSIQKMNRLN